MKFEMRFYKLFVTAVISLVIVSLTTSNIDKAYGFYSTTSSLDPSLTSTATLTTEEEGEESSTEDSITVGGTLTSIDDSLTSGGTLETSIDDIFTVGGTLDDPSLTFTAPLGRYTLGSITEADILERQIEILKHFLNDPSPNPESEDKGGRCKGRAVYAFVTYYLDYLVEYKNIDIDDDVKIDVVRANGYIESIAIEYDFEGEDPYCNECYFILPTIWRIYLDPKTRSRMSTSAKDSIKKIMWKYIYERSKYYVAFRQNVWNLDSSENHDANRKASYFLGVQALYNDPEYGPKMKLADDFPLEKHYEAWNGYWKEYFQERAREGLQMEIASPRYEKYAIANYYNIRDFAHDAILRNVAEQYLTLFWADTAQDYIKATGIRAGAATRVYKNKDLILGGKHSTRVFYYVYGWLDEWPGYPHNLVPMLTSTYRIPDIVNSIALSNKSPHEYISRKPGMIRGDNHIVEFDAGKSSNIKRYSYITPEYVLGTLTFDPLKDYTTLLKQNQTMGVMFASDLDARIIVHGLGADEGNGTEEEEIRFRSPLGGYIRGAREINGAASKNAMLVVRDVNAKKSSGTRIYLSDAGDIWTNSTVKPVFEALLPEYRSWPGFITPYVGWIFSQSGDAYIAIRIADGGFGVSLVKNKRGEITGAMLDLQNMWSPIVIQMGRSSDYSSFQNFKKSVNENRFRPGSFLYPFQYISEDGDNFQVIDSFPMVNRNDNLNPDKTYDSPYISGWHGEDTVTISHHQYSPLVLDFDFQNYTVDYNNVYDGYSSSSLSDSTLSTTENLLESLKISNLNVASGGAYEVIENGLQNGSTVYIDYETTFSTVPTSLEGATYIKTAQRDKRKHDTSFLSFEVNQDVIVYVGHDDRNGTKPSWLTSFTDTGDDIVTTDSTLSIYASYYLAGTIALGGNEGEAANRMYTVIVVGQ